MLLTAVVEWGIECKISKLIVETNPTWLLRMIQLHFRLMQLGLPRTMEGQDIIAVMISFDSRTVVRLYETRSTKKTVALDNTAHGPALLHA
jgi:acyl-homoserine lactone synthase